MGRLRFTSLLILIATAGLCGAAAARQQAPDPPARAATTLDSSGTWVLLSDLHAPPVVARPFGVYDSKRDRLLVLEGAYGTGWPAVHALDFQPVPHWSTLATEGPTPVGRVAPSLLYDPVRDRLLLFGGAGYADVWALTLSDPPTWQPLVTAGGPPRIRSGHSAVYDPVRDRMIVFGGLDGAAWLGDTWALSLRTNQWEPIGGGAGPSARAFHRAAYDPAGGRMIVFAGQDSAGLENDVWALPLGGDSSWTALAPEGPPPSPRSRFALAYDAGRTRLLVHGGLTATGYAGDLWALDLTGATAWTAIATVDSLEPRMDEAIIGDAARDRLTVYGGSSTAGSWDQSATLPLAGPLHWTRVLPSSPPLVPGPRTGQTTVYDSRRGRILVFGGSYRPSDVPAWSFTPDDDPLWEPLPVTGFVPAGPAVYDSLGDRLLVFTNGGDMWQLPLSAPTAWTPLEVGGPPDTSDYDGGSLTYNGASFTYDPRRHRAIVYGGVIGYPHSDVYTLRDVWAFDPDTVPRWTHLGQGPVPNGSAGHTAFYDPSGDRLVVVGGYWQSGSTIRHDYGLSMWATPLGDTLSWSVLRAAQPEPPSGQSVYDPIRRRLLQFSYYGSLGAWNVWSRPVADSVYWTQLTTVGAGPLAGSPIVFDPVRDRAVMPFTAPAGTVPAPPDQVWALLFGSFEIAWQGTTATLDGVEIVWRSPLAQGLQAMLQRREAPADWADLVEVGFDATGTLRARDASVRPGARYAYRLAMMDGATPTFTEPVWVDVPPRPAFALTGARPNPSSHGLSVVFSLPDAAPARLDVVDVAGRRVLTREVGDLGPGAHAFDPAPGRPLLPGLYLMRLTRAGQSRTARAVVIR
jgi:hypothetical protein